MNMWEDFLKQSFIEGMLISTFDIIGNIEQLETEEEFQRIMRVIHHEMDFVDYLRKIRNEHPDETSREWATIAYHGIYTNTTPVTERFQKYFKQGIEEELKRQRKMTKPDTKKELREDEMPIDREVLENTRITCDKEMLLLNKHVFARMERYFRSKIYLVYAAVTNYCRWNGIGIEEFLKMDEKYDVIATLVASPWTLDIATGDEIPKIIDDYIKGESENPQEKLNEANLELLRHIMETEELSFEGAYEKLTKTELYKQLQDLDSEFWKDPIKWIIDGYETEQRDGVEAMLKAMIL